MIEPDVLQGAGGMPATPEIAEDFERAWPGGLYEAVRRA